MENDALLNELVPPEPVTRRDRLRERVERVQVSVGVTAWAVTLLPLLWFSALRAQDFHGVSLAVAFVAAAILRFSLTSADAGLAHLVAGAAGGYAPFKNWWKLYLLIDACSAAAAMGFTWMAVIYSIPVLWVRGLAGLSIVWFAFQLYLFAAVHRLGLTAAFGALLVGRLVLGMAAMLGLLVVLPASDAAPGVFSYLGKIIKVAFLK